MFVLPAFPALFTISETGTGALDGNEDHEKNNQHLEYAEHKIRHENIVVFEVIVVDCGDIRAVNA